jgi:hypothetical protein
VAEEEEEEEERTKPKSASNRPQSPGRPKSTARRGSAKQDGEKEEEKIEVNFARSLWFQAPEMFIGGDQQFTKFEGWAIDVWAVGVALFKMVYGTTPFKTKAALVRYVEEYDDEVLLIDPKELLKKTWYLQGQRNKVVEDEFDNDTDASVLGFLGGGEEGDAEEGVTEADEEEGDEAGPGEISFPAVTENDLLLKPLLRRILHPNPSLRPRLQEVVQSEWVCNGDASASWVDSTEPLPGSPSKKSKVEREEEEQQREQQLSDARLVHVREAALRSRRRRRREAAAAAAAKAAQEAAEVASWAAIEFEREFPKKMAAGLSYWAMEVARVAAEEVMQIAEDVIVHVEERRMEIERDQWEQRKIARVEWQESGDGKMARERQRKREQFQGMLVRKRMLKGLFEQLGEEKKLAQPYRVETKALGKVFDKYSGKFGAGICLGAKMEAQFRKINAGVVIPTTGERMVMWEDVRDALWQHEKCKSYEVWGGAEEAWGVEEEDEEDEEGSSTAGTPEKKKKKKKGEKERAAWPPDPSVMGRSLQHVNFHTVDGKPWSMKHHNGNNFGMISNEFYDEKEIRAKTWARDPRASWEQDHEHPMPDFYRCATCRLIYRRPTNCCKGKRAFLLDRLYGALGGGGRSEASKERQQRVLDALQQGVIVCGSTDQMSSDARQSSQDQAARSRSAARFGGMFGRAKTAVHWDLSLLDMLDDQDPRYAKVFTSIVAFPRELLPPALEKSLLPGLLKVPLASIMLYVECCKKGVIFTGDIYKKALKRHKTALRAAATLPRDMKRHTIR